MYKWVKKFYDEGLYNNEDLIVFVNSSWISREEYEQITGIKLINATVDKPQIVTDGIDTAIITATVDDATSTELIELWQGETLVDSVNAINGVATFEITMIHVGTLNLTVKSTTKYGQTNVLIEGV